MLVKTIWNLFLKKKSNFAIAFILLYSLVTMTNYGSYKPHGSWGPFKYDQFAYYAYLPAIFIYKDMNFEFVKQLPENNPQMFWPTITADGKVVNKVTLGLSILLSPFFLTAHAYAHLVGEPLTGYSMPYRVAMFLSALFYMFLSLRLLRFILQRYYQDDIIAVTLIATFLGTNLFYYSVHEVMMSHSYSFFLYTLFIYLTIRWYENFNWRYLIVLGFTGGVIALVRPTNLLIVVFFLLFDVRSIHDFGQRVILLLRKSPQVLVALICAMVIIFPQLWWWKQQTGSWLFFSYGENERFYWSSPEILKGLFSYTKGWFVYTPMMIFSVAGFIWVRKYASDLILPLVIFTILNIYIVLSWWSWWYGGSFGLRAFVEFEAPLAMCFAATLSEFWKLKKYRIAGLATIFLLIVFNLFQTFQYKRGILRWSGMTKETYWMIFGKINLSQEEMDLREKLVKEPSRE